MGALATRFGKDHFGLRSDTPLNNDQIFAVAPSIFAAEAHESRSNKYTYIPTIKVLDGLRNEGFEPFMVAQSGSRIEGKAEFTKHMIRLRQPSTILSPEVFEIILVNSHDGTSSYQMLAGVFRFVCCNGMVTGEICEDIRVPHRGNITDNVIEAAYSIVDNHTLVQGSMERMKTTPLLLPESVAFAEAALSLKYDEPDKAPVTANQILQPRRREDSGQPDLWNAFNRVQENLTKGGIRTLSANGRRQTTREITSIDNNVKLNKALWVLAERMAELKGQKVAV